MFSIDVVANTAHHLYMFYFNQTMERSFIERFVETELGTEFSFNDLVTTADWWLYMERIFLANMHGLQHIVEDLNEEQNIKFHKGTSTKGEKRTKRENDENEGSSVSPELDLNLDGSASGGGSQDFEEVTEDIDDLSRVYLRDNLLLGPPRLRQIRIQENTCEVHDVFLTYFTNCYAGYSSDIELRTGTYMGLVD